MLALFTFTLFLSAALLFTVQPMFGKMILPMFGGSPAVWLTALVFFQLMLLAGYLYVHATVAWLGLRRQAALHVAVLLLPLAVLPVRVLAGWMPTSVAQPLASVSSVLFASIGLPFFALSASAPLLQRWLGSSRHPASRDPYFLYGASNLGSLGALLAYPVFLEPLLPLNTQSRLWSLGYAILMALTLACAIAVWRSGAASADAKTPADKVNIDATPAPWPVRLRWLALAAVPSSLLLSITAYITTDLAVPLLWVVPLAIYLATFALVFGRRTILPRRAMLVLLPFAAVVPLVIVTGYVRGRLEFILFHLLALFVAAMVCHGELAASRPGVRQLTEFYLWLSIGGAIGGLFNLLVAPLLFRTLVEYPLGLVLSCLMASSGMGSQIDAKPGARPATSTERERQAGGKRRAPALSKDRLRALWLDLIIAAALGVLVVSLEFVAELLLLPIGSLRFVGAVFAAPILIALGFRRQRIRFALVLAAIALAAMLYPEWGQSVIARERSFYGVYRIADRGVYRVLIHGTTNHGAQSLRPQLRCTPLSYYFPTGPLGYLFAGFTGEHAKSDIAVIGLGTGSTAGYARLGQRWTFYEIDPAIERIARDPRYFTFLRDCAPQARVVIGDGRISLTRQPDGVHDLIIFDAFSSDAIPVHLLTREALDLYLRKLAPRGVLAFHISNSYFDLRRVLSRLARDAHLVAYLRLGDTVTPAEQHEGKEASIWVVMARTPGDLGTLTRDPKWIPSLPDVTGRAWTDDYSDVLSTLISGRDFSF
ncbi:MAG TPA: fused MFS/spermidine synthase [Anaerolineales bacterium]